MSFDHKQSSPEEVRLVVMEVLQRASAAMVQNLEWRAAMRKNLGMANVE